MENRLVSPKNADGSRTGLARGSRVRAVPKSPGPGWGRFGIAVGSPETCAMNRGSPEAVPLSFPVVLNPSPTVWRVGDRRNTSVDNYVVELAGTCRHLWAAWSCENPPRNGGTHQRSMPHGKFLTAPYSGVAVQDHHRCRSWRSGRGNSQFGGAVFPKTPPLPLQVLPVEKTPPHSGSLHCAAGPRLAARPRQRLAGFAASVDCYHVWPVLEAFEHSWLTC